MIELRKIGVNELKYLADYFLQNRVKIEQVIADFGEIDKENGYGTFFLKPKNPLFRVFWIYCKDYEIISVGFGGPHLGLSLSDLHSVYKNFTEGFSRYDEEFVYVFYSSQDYKYTIKVTSAFKLFEDGKMISNVPINGLEIALQ